MNKVYNIVKKNIKAYDCTVEEYHKKTKDIEPVEFLMRKEFLSLLDKKSKILDVGCGPGRDAKFFSEQGYQVLGVDLSEEMIKKAKSIAPKADFKVMDFVNLDFEKESFNGTWFYAGLLCVPKRFAAGILKSINKILKKEGTLFINVKEGKGEGFELDKRYNLEKYYAYYSEEEFHELLTGAGFKIIKTYRPNLKSKYHTHQWICALCKK